MSLLPSPFAAALAGTGLACFAIGVTRRPDPGLKLTGLAVLAFALAPVPAHADQFVEAADNATVDCELARGELTRIALIDDGFANVSKIASGFPYNDFQVTHEPVRGDIYISVPPQFAAARGQACRKLERRDEQQLHRARRARVSAFRKRPCLKPR